MKQKLQHALLALTIALVGGVVAAPALVNADFKDDACQGVSNVNGTGCSTTAESTINDLMHTIIQVFSVIVGFVAVIMVIVGGIKYITANGDSGALGSARNTILYALVGLVVVALAQILVHFVIHTTAKGLPQATVQHGQTLTTEPSGH